jgi:hypothetical protein
VPHAQDPDSVSRSLRRSPALTTPRSPPTRDPGGGLENVRRVPPDPELTAPERPDTTARFALRRAPRPTRQASCIARKASIVLASAFAICGSPTWRALRRRLDHAGCQHRTSALPRTESSHLDIPDDCNPVPRSADRHKCAAQCRIGGQVHTHRPAEHKVFAVVSRTGGRWESAARAARSLAPLELIGLQTRRLVRVRGGVPNFFVAWKAAVATDRKALDDREVELIRQSPDRTAFVGRRRPKARTGWQEAPGLAASRGKEEFVHNR